VNSARKCYQVQPGKLALLHSSSFSLPLGRLLLLPKKICVTVGPQSFYVEKDLLCSISPFFQKAFSGPWIETNNRAVTITDTDPETFNQFLQWLRTDEDRSSNLSLQSLEYLTDRSFGKSLLLISLLRLWVLGDFLQIPSLQNDAIGFISNKYQDYSGKNISADTFEYVYQSTAPGSALRRIMVDFAAYKMTSNFYEQHRADFHGEFLEDFCSRLVKIKEENQETRHIFATMYYVPDRDAQKIQPRWIQDPKQDASPEQLASRLILTPKLHKPPQPSPPPEL
jgi:hypothetical protein